MSFLCCSSTKDDPHEIIVGDGLDQDFIGALDMPLFVSDDCSSEDRREAEKRHLTTLVRKFSEEATNNGITVTCIDDENNYSEYTCVMKMDKRLSAVTFESEGKEMITFDLRSVHCIRSSKMTKYFDLPTDVMNDCIGLAQEGRALIIRERSLVRRNNIVYALRILQLSFDRPGDNQKRKKSK